MKMQPPERARGVSEKPQEVLIVERGMRRTLGWSHLRAQAEQRPDGSGGQFCYVPGEALEGPGTRRRMRFLLLRGKPRVVRLGIRKTVLRL